jgi:hypothetical protein
LSLQYDTGASSADKGTAHAVQGNGLKSQSQVTK